MSTFEFWTLQIPGWLLVAYLALAQCVSAFSYKTGVRMGTQEPAESITEVGVATWWAFAFGDLVFYTRLLHAAPCSWLGRPTAHHNMGSPRFGGSIRRYGLLAHRLPRRRPPFTRRGGMVAAEGMAVLDRVADHRALGALGVARTPDTLDPRRNDRPTLCRCPGGLSCCSHRPSRLYRLTELRQFNENHSSSWQKCSRGSARGQTAPSPRSTCACTAKPGVTSPIPRGKRRP